MFNVFFEGRLGRDAELKEGKNGQFIKFSVATDGIKKDVTYWADVISSSPSVVRLSPYLTKGKPVLITGDIRAEIYTDRNQQPQIAYRVNATSLQFINVGSGRTDSDSATIDAPVEPQVPVVDEPKTKPAVTPGPIEAEEDLPF